MRGLGPRWHGIDPRLYFVTDTALCARAGRSVPQTVAAAVAGGAGLVQVRDKTLGDAAFLALCRDVIAAVAVATRGQDRRVPVIVNDRVALAARLREEGADVHVHIGQDDMPPQEARRRLGPQALIGLTTHAAGELIAAGADGDGDGDGDVDMIGLSPAFATTTKADAGPALGLARLRELLPLSSLPTFAIGGIDADRAAALRDSGVAGICVVSAICRAPDPARAARALRVAFGAATP